MADDDFPVFPRRTLEELLSAGLETLLPHDRDGALLNVGDTVIIPARIKEIHTSEDYCNVTIETTEKMYPAETCTRLSLNAKQVVRLSSNKGQ